MALFGGSRDVSLFNTINGELLKDIIQTVSKISKDTQVHK